MTTQQIVRVSGSQRTQGPGVYYVTAAGVTLTLETWTHWADAAATITVKDMTGSGTPNITVLAPSGGGVDGAASISIANPGMGLVFRPYQNGNTYGVTG